MRRIKDFMSGRPELYDGLWLMAPVVMWFSYWPNFHFGQDGTMNFELSLPLLLLVVLGLASLPSIIKNWRSLAREKWVWLIGALVVYSCLTTLWSVNPLRSLLTSGIIGLLGLVAIGAVAEREKITKLLPRMVSIYLWSAFVMSGLAVVQFVAGIWLPQSLTLLCDGCVSAQFGFPRPNVFAIEPQFFGNMLLPAILILAHRLMSGRIKWQKFDDSDRLGLMLLALFLTMSRGAIYALVVGLAILVVVYRRQFKNILVFAGVALVVLVASLSVQGLGAVANPTVSETFIGAVSKSINQLTMNVVKITPYREEVTPSEVISEPVDNTKAEPVFDGYVEESTNARTVRSDLALQAWQKSPWTILFGVGVGGAGVAMHQVDPTNIGAREIVQNELAERLLERGVVGLSLALVVVGWLFYGLREQKWLWAIIASLLFQLLFFSGYPNALHIYLILIILATKLAFENSQKSSK